MLGCIAVVSMVIHEISRCKTLAYGPVVHVEACVTVVCGLVADVEPLHTSRVKQNC